MASMGYPPFSAPATIERRKEAKSRSWLRSAKEVFMKPWKRQPANKRVPQARRRHNPLMSPGANPYEQQQPGFNFAHLKSKVQEEFPENHLYGDNVPLPFSGNRLSPDGGPGVSSRESESETEIKIPETAAYGSRPPLSNIFPIANKTSSSSSLTSKNSSKTSATKQVAPSAAKRPPSASPQAPPTTQAQPRPPTLPVTISPQPASMPPPALTTPPPPVTTPPVATVTPPSVAIPQVIPTPDTSPTQLPVFSSAQFNQRRHSTPITSSLSAPTTPRDHRRPSASSDISMDKLRNHRRDRRSSATREMPLLPKRGQDPFQCSSHSSTLSTPEPVTPYSEFTGSNISTQLQHQPMEIDPAQIAVRIAISPTASSQRPPVSPGGQPGTQQPAVSIPVLQVSPQAVLQPPHVELQDLQEELDNDDEPDGAENFLSMIEEIEEVEYPQYPPRNFNPISQARAPFPNAPIMKKEEPAKTSSGGGGGLGFGVKKGLRLSSKKQEKKQDKKNMQQAVQIPAHLQDPKEGQPEIKGFDGFFLY